MMLLAVSDDAANGSPARMSAWAVQRLGARFTDPLLRRFFGGGLNGMSAMAILMSLAWMSNKNAGYPSADHRP